MSTSPLPPEALPAANNLWVPDTAPHGFAVEMLTGRNASVAKEQFFAPREAISNELMRRYREHDQVRIGQPNEEASPDERAIPVHVPVQIERHDLMSLINNGQANSILGFYKEIEQDFAAGFGLSGAFPEAEQEALDTAVESTLSETYKPDWAKLPEETLDHASKVSQVLSFTGSGHEIRLYNFTDTIVDEVQAGKIANGLRELSDRTGGASMGMIKVMAIADVRDPLLYPQSRDGKHYAANFGVLHNGALILSEYTFDTSISLPPTDKSPDQSDEPEVSDLPHHVSGDEIQLTVYHEGLHAVAETIREWGAFADAVGWKQNRWRGWTHGAQNPDYQGLPQNPFMYGRTGPHEDLAVTGEADFAGGEARRQLDSARVLALQGLYATRHSGIQGPTFVKARELPLSASQTWGMPPREQAVLRPEYKYLITDSVLTATNA